MKTKTHLTGTHQRTYDKIFQHPISHNLSWVDVHAMFRQLCDFGEEPNGNFKVCRNGQTLVLHPPRTKDVTEMDEVMSLRHFLEKSELTAPEVSQTKSHWLLVIDHREARIFRTEMRDAVPLQFLPHEPEDYFRHAQDSMDSTRGKEKPDPNSYFAPIAKALQAADEILVFGAGKGTSSEMEQFIAWLETHHPELAARVIGSQVIDESHLTERQILAKAREFFAAGAAT